MRPKRSQSVGIRVRPDLKDRIDAIKAKYNLSPAWIMERLLDEHLGEVEQSYREWHHGVSGAELKEAQKAIFGVAP